MKEHRVLPMLHSFWAAGSGLSRRMLIAVFLLLFMPAAIAETTVSVRLPVDDQQAESREQAVRTAMEQVLVRLTGQEEVVRSDAVRPLLQQPGRFMQRYQYEREDEGKLMMAMQFDGTAVRQALAARGVASWQTNRPPVLVWLALERDGRRILVGGEDGVEERALLQSAATKRGLLLLFPLMDSEDQQRISPADVFGGFAERAAAAGERYGTAQMIMGRMHREGSGWASRWRLSGGDNANWSSTGATPDELLDAVAGELAVRQAKRYAVLPSAEDRRLRIQVSGVGNLRDFDRLQRYLRTLGGVAAVQPLSLEPDRVTLQLLLQTTSERILSALSQGRLLAAVQEPDEDAASGQGGAQLPLFRLAQ